MKRIRLFLVTLVYLLVLSSVFVRCASEGGPSFEGTWVSNYGVSYIFSGSKVTVKNSSNNYTATGVFTYTKTTLTFDYGDYKYTIGYVLNDAYLELTRLDPSESWFAGRFYKQ